MAALGRAGPVNAAEDGLIWVVINVASEIAANSLSSKWGACLHAPANCDCPVVRASTYFLVP
jgi:hypothetical protein